LRVRRRGSGVGDRSVRGPWLADGVARLSTQSPKTLLAVGVLISIVAALVLPRYVRDPFEYNFRNLRSARSESNRGEARWYDANEAVFGRALNPVVILA